MLSSITGRCLTLLMHARLEVIEGVAQVGCHLLADVFERVGLCVGRLRLGQAVGVIVGLLRHRAAVLVVPVVDHMLDRLQTAKPKRTGAVVGIR